MKLIIAHIKDTKIIKLKQSAGIPGTIFEYQLKYFINVSKTPAFKDSIIAESSNFISFTNIILLATNSV